MTDLIAAAQKDDALLDDIQRHRDQPGARLWWLGQSGFLVQHDGRHALIDPYLSDSLTAKYATTDKQHIRMSELVIDPRRLDFIDVASSSHNHTDHLDGETLKALIEVNPDMKLIVPEANRAFAADRIGCDPQWLLGVDDGTSAEVAGFRFHGLPAKHDDFDRDEQGRYRCLGYVVRFGDYGVFHPGDSLPYEGLIERIKQFEVDVALVPINGRKPERRVPGNYWGDEAATISNGIGAKLAVPMHYDMFTFNTETPADFVEHCERLGQKYQVMLGGERVDVPESS